MMQTTRFHFAVLLVLAFTTLSCEGGERDVYLKSLRITPEALAPVDSIDMERWDIYSSASIIKRGDWFLTRNTKGDHNVTAFNPISGDVLHFLPYGRGMGEVTMKGRLIESGGMVSVHDFGTNTVVSLRVEESLRKREQVLDTISHFLANMSYVNPQPCKDGFIVTSFKDAKVWYYLIDTYSKELSSIPAMSDDLLRNEQDPSMVMVNSLLTVSPDGLNICCAAMDFVALSFSSIVNGYLKENKRIELSRQEEAKTHTIFTGLYSDNNYVYVLYSGRPFSLSRNESDWLIVYNWKGKPLKCYNLAHSAVSITVEDSRAYCTTGFPNSAIHVYQLDKIE